MLTIMEMKRLEKPEVGDICSEPVFDEHHNAATHMNSHRLWLLVKTLTRSSQHGEGLSKGTSAKIMLYSCTNSSVK